MARGLSDSVKIAFLRMRAPWEGKILVAGRAKVGYTVVLRVSERAV